MSIEHGDDAITDRRAHLRIDKLSDTVEKFIIEDLKAHEGIREALSKNTELTQQVVINTASLVKMAKSAEILRRIIIWWAPFFAAAISLLVWFKKWLFWH